MQPKICELLSESPPLVVSRTEYQDNLGVLIRTIEFASDRMPGSRPETAMGRLVGYYEIGPNVTRN